MILRSFNGCYLTQAADVSASERRFETSVVLANVGDAADWREVTQSEKDALLAKAAFVDVDSLDASALGRVDELIAQIATKVNDAGLSDADALVYAGYYPELSAMAGSTLPVGFRFRYDGTLYEVTSEHTVCEGEVVASSGDSSASSGLLADVAADADGGVALLSLEAEDGVSVASVDGESSDGSAAVESWCRVVVVSAASVADDTADEADGDAADVSEGVTDPA